MYPPPAIHYLETPTMRVGLCSMGLKTNRKFLTTYVQTEVTCKSCIQKLIKYTGNTDLYKQAYPNPPIGI